MCTVVRSWSIDPITALCPTRSRLSSAPGTRTWLSCTARLPAQHTHALRSIASHSFFFLYMFLANQRFISHNFLLCHPSQRSARSQMPSQVATHQKIGSQLWAGEMLDLNPGLKNNSQACYHWATIPPPLSHHASLASHSKYNIIISTFLSQFHIIRSRLFFAWASHS